MRKLGKLLIRVLSLYYFIKAIILFKEIIILCVPGIKRTNSALQNLGVNSSLYFIINFIVILGIAVLLWIYTDKIVSAIIGNDSNDSLNINVEYRELLSIVLLVLGIIIVIKTLPVLLTQIPYYFLGNSQGYTFNLRLIRFFEIFGPVLKLAIGIYLIVKNRMNKNV
ncbi:hypothetical protein AN1V17_12370 [Vallitalea sediminicola]